MKIFENCYKLSKKRYLRIPIYWTGYLYLSLLNHIFNRVPFFFVRNVIYKYFYGVKLESSALHMGIIMFSPWNIQIGKNSIIHFDALLDGRGGLQIGNNVDISFGVKVFTEQHDIDSNSYETVKNPVKIEDNAIIGSYAIILPGVTVGEGAVVAAGSVVTKNVDPYILIGGAPARKIRDRHCEIRYKLTYKRPFH